MINKNTQNSFQMRTIIPFMLSFILLFVGASMTAAAEDLTTKYRVYQNDSLLKEFQQKDAAIKYAGWFSHSYVEDIETREWVYSSFPRYMVYQYDTKIGNGFHTLEEAIKEAKKYSYSSVRDVEGIGWAWDQYPTEPLFRVYQNDKTLDSWNFQTLEAAKQEAKKWGNSHIIDLKTYEWIWDNISDDQKANIQLGTKKYKVYQSGHSEDEWEFASLEDAKTFARQWEGSIVVNTEKQHQQVFSTVKKYKVYQGEKLLKGFSVRDDAISYAKRWSNGSIRLNDRFIWTNEAFFKVLQDGQVVQSFNRLTNALEHALSIQQAMIINLHGKIIWDNSTRLMFWAWNGSASDQTVKKNVSNTLGLDVNSPTWFELKNADGDVTDKSSRELMRWYKQRNIEVHPLIHNQFNNKLTQEFLKNPKAQERFITTIVNRAVELGVNGLNLDFESLYASDRDAFTDFIKQFSTAAQKKGLTVSIDLYRGSLAWNHLTAFDHRQIARYVDYIIIMTYDQHWSGSDTPGSVAGMGWTERGIQEFLSYGIPRDKLIMGIPFYIREWTLDAQGKLISNRAIGSGSVTNRLAGKDYTKVWDPIFEQYKISFQENGQTILFWLEDGDSVKQRLAIAKEYRLGGVATWRLGQESPEHWEAMIMGK